MRELVVEEETESLLKRVKKDPENARDGFIANETNKHDRVRIDPVMFIDCGKEERQSINT